MPATMVAKSRRRSRDLDAASAQKGDQEARDNGSVDTLLGADARRQCQGDRQWQRDNGDDDTGDHVLNELLLCVGLHNGKQFRL